MLEVLEGRQDELDFSDFFKGTRFDCESLFIPIWQFVFIKFNQPIKLTTTSLSLSLQSDPMEQETFVQPNIVMEKQMGLL